MLTHFVQHKQTLQTQPIVFLKIGVFFRFTKQEFLRCAMLQAGGGTVPDTAGL